MSKKIIEFLEQYLDNVEASIKRFGTYKTITAGLDLLIKRQSFEKEELRKELSIYTKRIISINEFNQLLDTNMSEYSALLYE